MPHLLPLAACAAIAVACASASSLSTTGNNSYDVIVYGATPAGVLAADAAAGEGARVLLLDPRLLIGGAMSGGLCNTDMGTDTGVIGGRALKFFEQVSYHYSGRNDTPPMYTFEPHVATSIFEDYFLASKGPLLTTSAGSRLVSLSMGAGARILSGTIANGSVFSAAVWVDASYEGFLLPLANVSHTYGREAASVYNESAAGVTDTVAHEGVYNLQPQLFASVDPFWANGSLLPLVQSPPGPLGSGDNRTQAYMFRLTTTGVAGNFLQPWPKPDAYDASEFELFRRLLAGSSSNHSIIGYCSNLPGGKCDANSQYFDQQGAGFSWDYPAAVAANDWEAQEAIWGRHRDLQLGLAYFLQNDPSLSPEQRAFMGTFGLPLDEYPASTGTPVAGFPPQLYVREALRMVSDFVLTQADREMNVNKSDSIGMGSYSIDVIPVSRFPVFNAASGRNETLMEGGIQAPSFLPPTLPPFQLPYRAITPPRAQATNLLVPGALSASHVAFCAVRLEPTWMVLGESAGVAAAHAAASGEDVQDLNVPSLQARLRQLGQVLEL